MQFNVYDEDAQGCIIVTFERARVAEDMTLAAEHERFTIDVTSVRLALVCRCLPC